MPPDDTPHPPEPPFTHSGGGAPAPCSAVRLLDSTARAIAQAQELEHRTQGIAQTLPTAEERAIEIVEEALRTLGASTGIAVRVIADRGVLALVGAAHMPADLADAFGTVSLDAPMPVAEVARTGRACYCESREQLLNRFPAMRELVERLDLHALAAVPVVHLAHVQGAVAFGFPAARRFTAGEKSLLRALGGRYARALHAARRFYAEHDARTSEEVARRTAEEARAVAEAAWRAQGSYVAVISHELRTPLQAILGFSDLLIGGVAGELTPMQRAYVERIATGGAALLEHVENLLGFSAAHVGRQHISVETFDVRQTVAEVVTLAEPLAGRKALALRVELPTDAVTMTSDARKLRQIVTNLVGNAIKFTTHGEVAVTLDVPAAERVRIAVRDTGVGIAASELPHLFDAFWQGGRRTDASVGGTGLGLSIVRQVVELLGGGVTVASAPGVGSTFTVELPTTAPAAPADPEPARD